MEVALAAFGVACFRGFSDIHKYSLNGLISNGQADNQL